VARGRGPAPPARWLAGLCMDEIAGADSAAIAGDGRRPGCLGHGGHGSSGSPRYSACIALRILVAWRVRLAGATPAGPCPALATARMGRRHSQPGVSTAALEAEGRGAPRRGPRRAPHPYLAGLRRTDPTARRRMSELRRRASDPPERVPEPRQPVGPVAPQPVRRAASGPSRGGAADPRPCGTTGSGVDPGG